MKEKLGRVAAELDAEKVRRIQLEVQMDKETQASAATKRKLAVLSMGNALGLQRLEEVQD